MSVARDEILVRVLVMTTDAEQECRESTGVRLRSITRRDSSTSCIWCVFHELRLWYVPSQD